MGVFFYMSIGWIKVHRKLKEHWIWSDPIKFQWWLIMLLEVNHKPNKINLGFSLYEVKRGQSARSLRTWSDLFNSNTKSVSLFFSMLEKDGMITKEIIGKGKQSTTLINITKYECYQGTDETQETTQEHTQGKRNRLRERDTNKNDKNIKNDNNDKKSSNSVELTPTKKHSFENSIYFEKKIFKEAFPDWEREKLAKYYESALLYSQSKGVKYLNWAAAIKNWEKRDNQTIKNGKSEFEKNRNAVEQRIRQADEYIAEVVFGKHQRIDNEQSDSIGID